MLVRVIAKVAAIGLICVLVASCGACNRAGQDGANGLQGPAGSNGTDGMNGDKGEDGYSALVDISDKYTSDLGSSCFLVSSGMDSNRNNTLDLVEVTKTQELCDGADGEDGASGTTLVTHIPVGITEVCGTVLVELGEGRYLGIDQSQRSAVERNNKADFAGATQFKVYGPNGEYKIKGCQFSIEDGAITE